MGEHHQDNPTGSTRIVRQSTFARPFILGATTVVVILSGFFLASFCMSGSPPAGVSHPPVWVTNAPPTPSTSARPPTAHPASSHHPHGTPVPEPHAQQPDPAPTPAEAPVQVVHTSAPPATQAASPSPSPSKSKKCILNALGICI